MRRRDVEDSIAVVCHEHPHQGRTVVQFIAEGIPPTSIGLIGPLLLELIKLDAAVLYEAYDEGHRN